MSFGFDSFDNSLYALQILFALYYVSHMGTVLEEDPFRTGNTVVQYLVEQWR